MIDKQQFNQYKFPDGRIHSMACFYEENTIELRLRIEKRIGKKDTSCIILLHFQGVIELDVLDDFSVAGDYSDVVLVRLPDGQVYASFDPYGNSGEPDEKDNFVIKAGNCSLKEVQ